MAQCAMFSHYRSNQAIVIAAALLTLALYSPESGANEASASMFSLGGFGTLGVVHSTEEQADFAGNILRPSGSGYSRDWSASVDSLLAVQANANFTSTFSAIVQVIAEQNYDDTYRPHVEWATLNYRFTPDFDLRLGRIVLPTFLLSDSRKVSYTYPWVRPPTEVYNLVPVTNSDGADARYSAHFGRLAQTLAVSYGNINLHVPGIGLAAGRRLWVLADTIEYGAATVHVAYLQSHLTIDSLDTLFDAFRPFGPQGAALANKYDAADKIVNFLGAGAQYDPGNWFLMGEWGSVDFHSAAGRETAWYVSSGYRVAKFTPYLTYARAGADNLSDPGLNASALPGSLAVPAAYLNATLDTLLSGKRVQNTMSAGARWDFMKSADLKLQYDYTRLGAGSSGGLTNLQPGFRLGGNYSLFSASIDFVF